jgi:hypothetical protein
MLSSSIQNSPPATIKELERNHAEIIRDIKGNQRRLNEISSKLSTPAG